MADMAHLYQIHLSTSRLLVSSYRSLDAGSLYRHYINAVYAHSVTIVTVGGGFMAF